MKNIDLKSWAAVLLLLSIIVAQQVYIHKLYFQKESFQCILTDTIWANNAMSDGNKYMIQVLKNDWWGFTKTESELFKDVYALEDIDK